MNQIHEARSDLGDRLRKIGKSVDSISTGSRRTTRTNFTNESAGLSHVRRNNHAAEANQI